MNGEPAVAIGIDSFAAAFERKGRAVSPAARLPHLIEQIENANEVGLDVIGVGEQQTSLAWMLRRPQESSVPAVLLRARINLQPSREEAASTKSP
jgi:hypothetical protein